MRRFALLAIIVLLAVIWIRPPRISASNVHAAGPRAATPSTRSAHTPSTLVWDLNTFPALPSWLRPSTRPSVLPFEAQFKVVRGQASFWRLAETADGVWWFVSPANQLEFLNTVTTVQPYQTARDKEGPSYISRDWHGGLNQDDGDLDDWAQKTIVRVKAAGFKGLGAWCHPIFHKHDIPISRDLNIWSWVRAVAPRFYSPQWAGAAEHAIAIQTDPLRNNTNLVGYYIDNELDWDDLDAGPEAYFDKLPTDDPNRQEVVHIIHDLWPTVGAFNDAWKVSLSDWKELDAWQTLPHQQPTAYGKLLSAWLRHLAGDYFRLTTSLIHNHDPNHLILGNRYKGWVPWEVVHASQGYTDAQSLNYYVSDARLDADMFRMIHEQSDQPLIISEYSFHALDGRSGNRNTVGFNAQVPDQQARADAYEQFTTRLARVPYIIGADWFQWSDEPPSGRSDGEDANFGVVDVDDRPYQTMVDAIRKTTPQLNGDHAASAHDKGTDIWRESFAAKPIAHVPFLSQPISLNGELSDWPAECKIPALRHAQTVGLERSKVPVPNVYLGWTNEGLYLGLEVFDQDTCGAPMGRWWTRDYVEFWISTRPVTPRQDTYDIYCHQFFFVPDFPSDDSGAAGVVGQWHRPGDALQENIVPARQIHQAARILPDRYVVEMFIPARAMNGFDPAKYPTLAFNIHARNFQRALDYFWSAPKEVMTQMRPCTWGTLKLEPPSNLAQSAADQTATLK